MKLQTLSIENMQLLVVVADEGSISRAAERLFLDTSSISRRIKNLENELETAIFSRSSKGVKLTNAGNYVYDFSKQVLSNLTELENQLSTPVIENLSLGTYDSVASNHFQKFFSQNFNRLHELKISNNTQELLQDFNSGKLDAVLMDSEFSLDLTSDFVEQKLFDEAYFLLSKNPVDADLTKLSLILYPDNCPIHQKVIAVTKKLPKIKVIDFAESAVSFVEKSDFVTILPESIAKKYSESLYLQQLPGSFDRHLSLFSRNKAIAEALKTAGISIS